MLSQRMINGNELNGDEHNAVVLQYSHTPVSRHIGDALLRHWKRGLFSAGLTLSALLAVPEYMLKILDIELSIFQAGTILLVAPIIIAILIIAISYYNHVPSGFEDESRKMQRIANIKRIKWETRLSLGLLKQKLGKTEMKINDVIAKRVYVPVTSNLEVDEYRKWLDLRPINLLRMIEVAKNLLLRDLIGAMAPVGEEMPSPVEILKSVNRVAALYESTYKFGIEGRSIEAPDGFERVHEIQEGWVEIIQDTILQLYDFFEIALAKDVKKENKMKFKFTFETAANIDEFNAELKRLRGNGENLM